MGMSLLHYAAMNRKPRNTEMLEFLLQKGAEVNAIASDNTTPLDYAASTGMNRSESLIKHNFIRPKRILWFLGNMEMVRLLLDAGAAVNVNFKDSNGDTAIMYAAYGTGGGNVDFQTALFLQPRKQINNSVIQRTNFRLIWFQNQYFFQFSFNRSPKSLSNFNKEQCWCKYRKWPWRNAALLRCSFWR